VNIIISQAIAGYRILIHLDCDTLASSGMSILAKVMNFKEKLSRSTTLSSFIVVTAGERIILCHENVF
jgi:hypothetical protein